MIYTNLQPEFGEGEDVEGTMHLWLDGMVDETDEDEEGRLVPQLSALCGVHVEDLAYDEEIPPQVLPANETWAEGLIDLLGDNRLCEECRTRAAVYFDRQDEVTLGAANADVDVCPECESYKRQATIANMVSKEEGTVIERRIECHECGHEWEDELPMEAVE